MQSIRGTEKISRINRYIRSLSSKEKDVLLEELKKNSLRNLAVKLSRVKSSPLTMEQINKEVKIIRKKRSKLHVSE